MHIPDFHVLASTMTLQVNYYHFVSIIKIVTQRDVLILVMVLEQPVRKSKYIIPICLPKPTIQKESLIGRRATIVGWGTTYYGGKESPVQREATLPIWRNEDCNRAYFQPITENFICAGYSEGVST